MNLFYENHRKNCPKKPHGNAQMKLVVDINIDIYEQWWTKSMQWTPPFVLFPPCRELPPTPWRPAWAAWWGPCFFQRRVTPTLREGWVRGSRSDSPPESERSPMTALHGHSWIPKKWYRAIENDGDEGRDSLVEMGSPPTASETSICALSLCGSIFFPKILRPFFIQVHRGECQSDNLSRSLTDIHIRRRALKNSWQRSILSRLGDCSYCPPSFSIRFFQTRCAMAREVFNVPIVLDAFVPIWRELYPTTYFPIYLLT